MYVTRFYSFKGYFGQLVSGDATSTFQALVKEYWDWRLLDAPEFASSIGVNTYNDKVESFSLQVLDDRKVCVYAQKEITSQTD